MTFARASLLSETGNGRGSGAPFSPVDLLPDNHVTYLAILAHWSDAFTV